MPGKRKAVLVGIAGSHNAFSLSLYSLKAYAYRDAEVRDTWDLQIIQHPLINLQLSFARLEGLADQIVDRDPELVALSCYMWNVAAFAELSRTLRHRLPAARIVWGGPEMATDHIVEGRADSHEMDFCVSGEGEATFLELLRHLSTGSPALPEIPGLAYRQHRRGPFAVNPRRVPFGSLSEIPSPFLSGVVDDEVLTRRDIEANLETQRGCTLKCTYCIYHKDMDRIAYAAPSRTLEELVFVINKGVRRIRFVDANFSSSLDHAKVLMRGMIERRFEARLMFELIPGFIDEELATLFAEYNALHDWNEITLGLGVQTVNHDVLKRLRRGIKVERFEATFRLIEKYELYAKIDLIIGLPGEDLSSIERTLEYMMDQLRDSRAHLLCCHVMRGLPGTELLEQARAFGMVFSSTHEPHELMESPTLPREQMVACLRRTAVIFRLINHAGWASREFISGKTSEDSSIRDAFFAARDSLRISNVAVVDLLVEGLMKHLAPRGSDFVQPGFPRAETWWWNFARHEISDRWLIDSLTRLAYTGIHEAQHEVDETRPSLHSSS